MLRRTFIKATAATGITALCSPAVVQAQQQRVLRFIPGSGLVSLDPIWTTANITRTHAFLVYDTLYGLDAGLAPSPQMAAGHVFADDGRTCTVTLRPGLRFHDGEPVLARDCVASLRRWMRRSPLGDKLGAALVDIATPDDRTLIFQLRTRFPIVQALACTSNPIPFIMPERLARTDPFTQVREVIGSGPYKFIPSEYVDGSRVAYERFEGYAPSQGGSAGLTAGPKVAHFDRVVWNIVSDGSTAASALIRGEADWVEQPSTDLTPLFKRAGGIVVEPIDTLPLFGSLRFNQLHPPFDRAEMRRALLPAISQDDFMQAVVGTDPALYMTDVGFFAPGSPLASDEALEPLRGPRSLDRAKAMLRDAGYDGGMVRLIGPTDILSPAAMTQVAADVLRRLGLNLDLALSDWGTVVQRRTSKESLDHGGWSVFTTAGASYDCLDPGVHAFLRGNGQAGTYGWPTSTDLERLRDDWFAAPDMAEQKRIARQMQAVAMRELPYIPLGAYLQTTAYKGYLRDRVKGFPIFWNIRRSA